MGSKRMQCVHGLKAHFQAQLNPSVQFLFWSKLEPTQLIRTDPSRRRIANLCRSLGRTSENTFRVVGKGRRSRSLPFTSSNSWFRPARNSNILSLSTLNLNRRLSSLHTRVIGVEVQFLPQCDHFHIIISHLPIALLHLPQLGFNLEDL